MNTRNKMLIGGVGALMPSVLNLLVVDFSNVFSALDPWAAVGYCVRVIVLFALGGVVAYLHKEERNVVKLFELGIVAPALITAMINASNSSAVQPETAKLSQRISFSILPSAVAAPQSETNTMAQHPNVAASAKKSFWRGVFGSRVESWVVVVATYRTREEAAKKCMELKRWNIAATVVVSPSRARAVEVIAGPFAEYQGADQTRQQLLRAGVSEYVDIRRN
jgi:cell division septation protein DedD